MRLVLATLIIGTLATSGARAAPWLRPRQIEARLRALARADPTGRVRAVELGRSRRGRPILALVVGRSEHRVLYVGLHHAREWLAADMVLRLAEHLAGAVPAPPRRERISGRRAGSGSAAPGARAARLVATREAWLVPVVNPDGLALSFDPGRRDWRKNARDNDGDGKLGPADGVDLNRNYDFHWGTAPRASPDPLSPEYRGPAPFSEPETRALRDLFAAHRFAFAVSYHAFGSYLVYPAADEVVAHEPLDAPLFRALAGSSARPAIRSSLRRDRRGLERYRVEMANPDIGGRFGAWAYHRAGVPAFYVELADGYGFSFPDDERWREQVLRDNLPFALDLLESAADPARPVSHLGNVAPPLVHRPPGRARGSEVLLEVSARRGLGRVALFYQGKRGTGWVPLAPLERGAHYARYGALLPHPGGALRYYFRAGSARLPARGSFVLRHDGPGGTRLVVTSRSRQWREWLEAAGIRARIWSHPEAPDPGTVLRGFRSVIWDARKRSRHGNAAGLRALARFVRAGGQAVLLGGSALGRGPERRPHRLTLAPGLPGKPERRQVDIAYIPGGVAARDYVRRAVRALGGVWLDGRTRRAIDELRIPDGKRLRIERQRPLQLGGATPPLVTGPPLPPWECRLPCWQSGATDQTLARLGLHFEAPALSHPTLELEARWDLEPRNDYFFVEARPPGGRWTTLPELGGRTESTFGPRRERNPAWRRAWVRVRARDLLRYLTPRSAPAGWKPRGASGQWHALTGRGRGTLRFDLSRFAGSGVELAFAYLADPYRHGRGVALDAVRLTPVQRRWKVSTAWGPGRWAQADSPAFAPSVAAHRGRFAVATVDPADVRGKDRARYLRLLLDESGRRPAPTRDARAEGR